jgi:23S rRNA U2552 (ribose-2'-O)-methylase RlmE/FtsJ
MQRISMAKDGSKPPWMDIQWFPATERLQEKDLYIPYEEGEWQEDHYEDIEKLKESIQPYDKSELWDLAKRITNPFELISSFSSRLRLPRSTCCLHPLSRSFFKMIEILHHLDFFERHKNPKYKSLHICEGPGGFIEAFHYLAQEKNKIISSSHAMTLKSTHVMIPGWKRASQFLQKHTNIYLLFGPKKTGDIYDPENQAACQEAVGSYGAHLVTADGGFDFSEDFTNQEKNILRLIVCSCIILLECVAHEGDVVLKMFDCNSIITRDIIRIMSSCFVHWTLYKPVTSRPCNSEWYFIGKGAHRDRRIAVSLLKKIRDGLAHDPPVSYSKLLSNNSLDSFLKDLQRKRCEKQKKALMEVLSFCKDHENIDNQALWESQRNMTISWCHYFRMPSEFKMK